MVVSYCGGINILSSATVSLSVYGRVSDKSLREEVGGLSFLCSVKTEVYNISPLFPVRKPCINLHDFPSLWRQKCQGQSLTFE